MLLKIVSIILLQIGRLPPTFLDAAKAANAILNCGYEFTEGKIIYNKFKSVVSYSISDMPVFSLKTIEVSV
jgi:F-type H+-transporting ATPase subunit gamma